MAYAIKQDHLIVGGQQYTRQTWLPTISEHRYNAAVLVLASKLNSARMQTIISRHREFSPVKFPLGLVGSISINNVLLDLDMDNLVYDRLSTIDKPLGVIVTVGDNEIKPIDVIFISDTDPTNLTFIQDSYQWADVFGGTNHG